jgi:hypothetical protein
VATAGGRPSSKTTGFVRLREGALAVAGMLLLAVAAAAVPADTAPSQATTGFAIQAPPRVFLDAPGADLVALQKGIAFVDWVAAAADAEVVVSIRFETEPTGERTAVLSFQGRKEFVGDDETLRLPAPPGPEPDQEAAALNQTLKLGLMRYVGKTPVSKRIDIALRDKVKPTAVADPWNFWVFSLSADGFYMGYETYTSRSTYGSVTANRTTPDWKVRLSANAGSYRSVYRYEGEEIISTSENRSAAATIVRSLDDHWSVGGFVLVYSSTYANYKINAVFAPAVEFDLFPYSESTRHQLRFLYKLGFNWVRYREETIYDKMKESLFGQSLNATLELNRPWGTASVSLEGSHYLNDIRKNRLQLNSEISVRIFKGLSFNIDGGGSRIRDQINLAKGGASFEEVILRRKQIATSYNYYFSVGLSLTFGSTRSNVVNPRFGSGGTSVSISTGG